MNFTKTIKLIPNDFTIKIFPDANAEVTGAQLRRYSAAIAVWLQEKSYKLIGAHMGNCPEFLFLFAGAMRAGVRVRLLNALNSYDDDIPVFEQETVRNMLDSCENSATEFSEYDWKIDEPIIEIYTSGTSGKRKLIEKSIKNYLECNSSINNSVCCFGSFFYAYI